MDWLIVEKLRDRDLDLGVMTVYLHGEEYGVFLCRACGRTSSWDCYWALDG